MDTTEAPKTPVASKSSNVTTGKAERGARAYMTTPDSASSSPSEDGSDVTPTLLSVSTESDDSSVTYATCRSSSSPMVMIDSMDDLADDAFATTGGAATIGGSPPAYEDEDEDAEDSEAAEEDEEEKGEEEDGDDDDEEVESGISEAADVEPTTTDTTTPALLTAGEDSDSESSVDEGYAAFLRLALDESSSSSRDHPAPPSSGPKTTIGYIGEVVDSANDGEGVKDGERAEDDVVRIGINVGGMTCSHCVKSVTNAITIAMSSSSSSSADGGIRDVEVDLAAGYARVTLGRFSLDERGMMEAMIESIVESIEDIGFEAALDPSTVPSAGGAVRVEGGGGGGTVVDIGISVVGMTFSHCVTSVTNAIMNSSSSPRSVAAACGAGVLDVRVDLAAEYVHVAFDRTLLVREGMAPIEAAVEAIDDIGFIAILDLWTVPLAIGNHHQHKKKTVVSGAIGAPTKPVSSDAVVRPHRKGAAAAAGEGEGSIQIGITVGGMTCSNCIKSVSRAIVSSSPDESAIKDVKINLATEYALVTYIPHLMGKRGMEAIESIVESIEDAGYEAALDLSSVPPEIRRRGTHFVQKEEESIQIGISVGGMTCSNCIKSVSNAIFGSSDDEGGIEDVKINLATEYALVTYRPHLLGKPGMDAIDHIVKSIEDAGYEATLDGSTVPDSVRNHHANDGMDVEMGGFGGGAAPSGEDRAKALKKRQERDIQNKRRAFLLSLIGTVPVMMITMVLGKIPAVRNALMTPVVPGLTIEALLLWILATPVQFGSGWVFYRNAYHSVRNRMLGMDVLVVLGTSTAYLYSAGLIAKGIAVGVPEHHGAHFFETSAVLISFVLLGKWMQLRAVRKTSSALEKLMGLAAKSALVIVPREVASSEFDPAVHMYDERDVPVELVQRFDVVKVIRGSSIPADGKVLSGDLTVNESMITGEPMPVYKTVDSSLVGGTIVTEGTAFMTVERVGRDTSLSKICRMVEEAAASQAPIQLFADKVSSIFVPLVVATSIITFITWISLCSLGVVPEEWYAGGSIVNFSLLFAIAVMVISCPCALGLATPTAVMVGTGVGASHGILIKGGEQLQHASEIDAIIFDKTGTLTQGKPVVSDFLRITNVPEGHEKVKIMSDKEVLWILGSLERNSEHPLASAIVSYAEQRIPEKWLQEKPFVDPSNFIAVTGKGVSGEVESMSLAIGNRAYAQEFHVGLQLTEEIEQEMVKIESVGKTAVLAIIDGVVAAVVGISDAMKEDSIPSIRYLREEKNIEVWLVTGDNTRTASAVADKLGLPMKYVLAEAAPEAKLEKVKSLQREGKVVAMVGDGINDSPALAQADVGISIGSGTEIAAEAADMVLVKGNVADVCSAIDLSRTIFRRIRLNYLWALLYNCLGIPIAAGVFYPIVQVRLPPAVAAVAMALSSISVVVSSLALKLYKPPDIISKRSTR